MKSDIFLGVFAKKVFKKNQIFVIDVNLKYLSSKEFCGYRERSVIVCSWKDEEVKLC